MLTIGAWAMTGAAEARQIGRVSASSRAIMQSAIVMHSPFGQLNPAGEGRYGQGVGQVPEDIAEKLAQRFSIERAVETGTYRGESTRRLARLFPKVETIELSARLALQARLKFLRSRNVRVLRGNSAELLGPSEAPTLYWLDAHWSGGPTAGATAECPLLAEIEATSPGDEHDCYLIDDAQLFLEPPPSPHNRAHWPTIAEIDALVSSLRPGHTLVVVDDVIAIVPRSAGEMVSAHNS
jgi:hypothetical protein